MTDFVSKRRKTKGKVREVSSREAKREGILYSFSLWQIDRGVLGFAYRACDGRGGKIKKKESASEAPSLHHGSPRKRTMVRTCARVSVLVFSL